MTVSTLFTNVRGKQNRTNQFIWKRVTTSLATPNFWPKAYRTRSKQAFRNACVHRGAKATSPGVAMPSWSNLFWWKIEFNYEHSRISIVIWMYTAWTDVLFQKRAGSGAVRFLCADNGHQEHIWKMFKVSQLCPERFYFFAIDYTFTIFLIRWNCWKPFNEIQTDWMTWK